jgi:hypothetical protein
MEPPTTRWARIGPTNRKWLIHVPAGGLCLSTFVLVRNSHGDVLFGRPRAHRNWPEKGGVGVWRVRDLEREGAWTLPATHLLIGEDPAQGAKRIARTWGSVANPRPHLLGIDSCRMPTGQWKGVGRRRRQIFHWAVGFVYEVRASRIGRTDPGWSELRFIPRARLRSLNIGRDHRDFLKYLT